MHIWPNNTVLPDRAGVLPPPAARRLQDMTRMCFAATMNGCTKGTMMNAKAVYQPEKTGPYFNGGNPAMQAWAVLLSEVYKMCMFATAESRKKAWPDSKGCDPFEARGAPGAAWSDYHLANHVLYLAK